MRPSPHMAIAWTLASESRRLLIKRGMQAFAFVPKVPIAWSDWARSPRVDAAGVLGDRIDVRGKKIIAGVHDAHPGPYWEPRFGVLQRHRHQCAM